MLKELMSYIDYPMVKVPGGEIELRDDKLKANGKLKSDRFFLPVILLLRISTILLQINHLILLIRI